MRDESYAEREAYDSTSVVSIHTRSELSSDSDSASVASVASVNQPLECKKAPNFLTRYQLIKVDISQMSLQGVFFLHLHL